MRAARTLSAVLPLLVLLAPFAHAGGAERIDCSNAMSTYEMNACADKDFTVADANLNRAYQSALKSIPEMATEKPYDAKGWEAALRASQRAWVAFRDAECNNHVAMFWSGGTGATADIIGCMTDKTKARTKELQDRYETK